MRGALPPKKDEMDFETVMSMGEYAFHVWGSYGLAAIIYIGMMAWSLAKLDRLKKLDKK